MLDGLPFVERSAWFTLSTRTSPTGLYSDATANVSGAAYRSDGGGACEHSVGIRWTGQGVALMRYHRKDRGPAIA
ncbi:hypothetical protein ABZ801_20475 [Actinomadura sp. NPDC047616]|uniref:hypothetical protein n=1 Tax=Actinomadura sp. NPDC047616 TaxID=3155914 RepID=UPI003403D017